ncbi:MAG: VOC family protein [Enterocloster citroniae]|nr:VOC family protein [Enterocloster citroniae]
MEHIKGLHHIGLPVRNMEGTLAFYRKLGAEIVYEKQDVFEEEPIRVVLLGLCGTVLELFERPKTAGIPGAFDHIAFETDCIEELYDRALEEGFAFHEDCRDGIQISTYWPNHTKWFILLGVNGEKIEFCQEC